MKILITGANGFVGSNLIEHLANGKDELFVSGRKKIQQIDYKASYSTIELTEYSEVLEYIASVKPDQIYNMAGSMGAGYDIDYRNNVLVPKNIMDAVLEMGLESRILLVGSAAEYGLQPNGPVSEDATLNPVSLYGVTKCHQTNLAKYYANVHDIDIVIARTFNLYGPNASNSTLLGRAFSQIQEIRSGKIQRVSVGSLENYRDYINISDAVDCFVKIMNHGIKGEIYNVGSGEPVLVRDVLYRLLEENGFSRDIVNEVNNSDHRKLDLKKIYSDMSKTKKIG